MPKYLPFLLSFLLLSSCGGSGGGDSGDNNNAECSVINMNRTVLDVMNDIYLYYDQLPNLAPEDYRSPEEFLMALRVPPDRFSYLADTVTQDNFFEAGTYEGFGFSIQELDDAFVVLFVFTDSPAGRAGLQRSDRLLAINGISSREIINDHGGFNNFISNEEGPFIISIRSTGEEPRDVELSIDLVTMNTVIHSEVIENNNSQIGYLGLSSFLEPTKEELATVFQQFVSSDIRELILDLRYNGGGRVTTAQRLASFIAGDDALGANTAKLVYNDRYQELNESFPFENVDNAVNLRRLYVLTLPGTCSASELIINALQAINIDVITVGQTTCGKPVGSIGFQFCDKTLNPITFDVFNDLNQGDYFDGFSPTCAASDDTTKRFGDPEEGMLAVALSHLDQGQCPAVSVERGISSSSSTKEWNIMQMVK